MSGLPLPAGPVSCTPWDLAPSAEDIALATMKGPALRTGLSTHHLGCHQVGGRTPVFRNKTVLRVHVRTL